MDRNAEILQPAQEDRPWTGCVVFFFLRILSAWELGVHIDTKGIGLRARDGVTFVECHILNNCIFWGGYFKLSHLAIVTSASS